MKASCTTTCLVVVCALALASATLGWYVGIHRPPAQRTLAAALLAATECNDAAAVASLLRRGADPEAQGLNHRTPLMIAAVKANVPAVQSLLAAGADVNAQSYGRTTALIFAAAKGDVSTVATLLAAGADVHPLDHYGRTALSEAKRHRNGRMISLLQRAGARDWRGTVK